MQSHRVTNPSKDDGEWTRNNPYMIRTIEEETKMTIEKLSRKTIGTLDETVTTLTANQKRAAVIAKAKSYVEQNKPSGVTFIDGEDGELLVEGSVSVRSIEMNNGYVNNKHLMMAVVTAVLICDEESAEFFDNVPEPDTVVVGMIVKNKNDNVRHLPRIVYKVKPTHRTYNATSWDKETPFVDHEESFTAIVGDFEIWFNTNNYKIIDDTDAIYESIE